MWMLLIMAAALLINRGLCNAWTGDRVHMNRGSWNVTIGEWRFIGTGDRGMLSVVLNCKNTWPALAPLVCVWVCGLTSMLSWFAAEWRLPCSHNHVWTPASEFLQCCGRKVSGNDNLLLCCEECRCQQGTAGLLKWELRTCLSAEWVSEWVSAG